MEASQLQLIFPTQNINLLLRQILDRGPDLQIPWPRFAHVNLCFLALALVTLIPTIVFLAGGC